AEEELNRALNDTLGPLVRAMVLKAEVMGNPLANTTGHQGYIEPEKEVMQQVVTFLTGKVSAFSVTPADEPVLSLTGFPAVALRIWTTTPPARPASVRSGRRKSVSARLT
ncbi:hypothetical protein H228_5501, partial [Klebsiella pneumoniae UHKPC06]